MPTRNSTEKREEKEVSLREIHQFRWDCVTPRLPAKKLCLCGLHEDNPLHTPTKEDSTEKQEKCPKCNGKRIVSSNRPPIKDGHICFECGGTGIQTTQPTKETTISCLGANCPERFSLCCNARCTNGKKGEPQFVCSKCRKEFVGGECGSLSQPTKEKNSTKQPSEWEKEFVEMFVAIPFERDALEQLKIHISASNKRLVEKLDKVARKKFVDEYGTEIMTGKVVYLEIMSMLDQLNKILDKNENP